MTYRFAVIGGDGVGPEVIKESRKVLEAASGSFGFAQTTTDFDLGAERYLRTGEVLPESVEDELAEHDAILLGAVGAPRVPPGVLERGLLLKLRFDFDLYVNLRPIKLYPGVATPIAGLAPERCDLVVVRENTEGLYVGAGGIARRDTAQEIATQESINTRFGVERVVRYSFEQAAKRRGQLTLCHKTNVLTFAGDLWQRTVLEVAADYPEVTVDYVHVDAACLYLVTQPERFDVIVTDNLFGDIITDLGAAVQGGMGVAASGNINPDRTFPSMFEPVHGSAPDIAGKGRANPVAAILSLAMCLDHLGETDAAVAVEQAAVSVLTELGSMTTPEIGDLVAARVRS
ncbi:MAG: 3-isopropylmalate dehydrogenase [Acidimicrobiia bacterium]